MSLDRETELSQAAADSFLASRETGVLSLAHGDEPYAIPVSYGYDPGERQFYFRLVSNEQSEKRRFLENSSRVRLVVYDEADPIYRSIVATGNLREIPLGAVTVEQIEQYGDAKRPLFEIWGESRRELGVQLYLLESDEITGRRIEIDRREDRA